MIRRLAPTAFALAALAAAVPPAGAQDARNQAYERLLQNPNDTDAAIAYVRAALAAGDREAAVGALERLLLIGDNPTLRLELAQLYLDIGAASVAQQHIDRALASGRLDPAQRARAERLKTAAERQLSPHRLAGSVMGGMRYQTNANAGTNQNLISLGGQPTVTPSSSKKEPDWDVFALAHAEHSYDFRSGRNVAIESTLDAYVSRQFNETSFSLSYLEGTSGIRFEPSSDVPGLSLRPHVVGGVSSLGNRIYGSWFGPGIDVTYRMSSGPVAYGQYQLRKSYYEDVDVAPFGSEQSGDDNIARAGLRYVFADGSLAIGELVGRVVVAERSFYSYSLVGARARYGMPLGIGEGLTGRPWYLLFGGDIYGRWFESPDPNVDPNVTRDEVEWRLTASLSVPIADAWDIVPQIDYTRINSNLNNFDYENLAAWLGLRWRF